jgi:hypothetical protein
MYIGVKHVDEPATSVRRKHGMCNTFRPTRYNSASWCDFSLRLASLAVWIAMGRLWFVSAMFVGGWFSPLVMNIIKKNHNFEIIFVFPRTLWQWWGSKIYNNWFVLNLYDLYSKKKKKIFDHLLCEPLVLIIELYDTFIHVKQII